MTIWGASREIRDRWKLSDSLRQKRYHHSHPAGYWLVMLFVLLLDQLSKWIIAHTMVLNQSLALLDHWLSLTYVQNQGAAFSLLATYDSPWRMVLLIGIPLAAFILLTLFAYRKKSAGRRMFLPLGLISGGALGNLVNRIASGQVVDFIDVGYRTFHWPVFNLADSAVVIGVCLFILLSWPKRSKGVL